MVALKVIVAQSSAQAPNVPYAIVSQVQPPHKKKEIVAKLARRKSTRTEKVKLTS